MGTAHFQKDEYSAQAEERAHRREHRSAAVVQARSGARISSAEREQQAGRAEDRQCAGSGDRQSGKLAEAAGGVRQRRWRRCTGAGAGIRGLFPREAEAGDGCYKQVAGRRSPCRVLFSYRSAVHLRQIFRSDRGNLCCRRPVRYRRFRGGQSFADYVRAAGAVQPGLYFYRPWRNQ
ncbi:hypothetical protein D3C71_1469480 [compost metagenome]